MSSESARGVASDRKAVFALVGGACLLIVLLAWPVLQAPSERLFGNEIIGRHPDAYWSIRDFDRATLDFRTQPVTDFAGVAAARFVGAVAALNLLTLLSFPLAALFTFWLARYLGVDRGPAAMAALFYAFSSFHLAHAAYHPHIAQTQWLPLYLLALWRCLDRWSLSRALQLVGAAGLVGLSNFYAGYFALALTPFAMAAYGLAAPRRPAAGRVSPVRELSLTALTLVGSVALGSLWVVLLFPGLLGRLESMARPTTHLWFYGARTWSFLVPAVDHLLLGRWVLDLWQREGIGDGLLEQQVGLGVAMLVLAAVPVVLWLRGRRDTLAQRAVPALAAVAVVAFLFSLAPADRDGQLLLRPAALLYLAAPIFRAFARFGAFVDLMVALLAAIGFAALAQSSRRWARPLALCLVVVAAFENLPLPPTRSHEVLPTAAHRVMAGLQGPWKLLDCISGSRSRQAEIGGLMRYPVVLLDDDFVDCAEPGLAGKAAALGFTHLLFRADSPEGDRLATEAAPEGLEIVFRGDDSALLRVAAPPATVFVQTLEGFSWREHHGATSFRWMADRGMIRLLNSGPADSLSLRLVLHSYQTPHHLRFLLRGVEIADVVVGLEPQEVVIGPIEAARGTTPIEIEPDPGAECPAEMTGSADTRHVSVALWDWSLVPAGPSGAPVQATD